MSCVLHFQHKGYRANRDTDFKSLRPAAQSQARYLGAILQVATQLDSSATQSTVLKGVDLHEESVVLRVMGPDAKTDGKSACHKAWLWRPVFHSGLEFVIGPRSVAADKPVAPADRDESAGAAFGRQLAAALRLWEPRQSDGASSELLMCRDQLAGVGKAQAAVGAFGSMLKRRPVKDVKRPLRTLHRRLAAVVEQQNAISDLETYMDGRPPAVIAELQPLRDAWARAAAQRQAAMLAYLPKRRDTKAARKSG